MEPLTWEQVVEQAWEAIQSQARAKGPDEGTQPSQRGSWTPEVAAAQMVRQIRHEEGVE